ncbi:hypothetical protein E2C01_001591 [Portunus trituberculatus]|uniref:Uncharacterized protein n=1 Tax=Portunus trituberculatus TaxID=210409 RepID=A0A5B7CMW4_PORTR|nr:hypothetical protein [Portunus trituberculatus]
MKPANNIITVWRPYVTLLHLTRLCRNDPRGERASVSGGVRAALISRLRGAGGVAERPPQPCHHNTLPCQPQPPAATNAPSDDSGSALYLLKLTIHHPRRRRLVPQQAAADPSLLVNG